MGRMIAANIQLPIVFWWRPSQSRTGVARSNQGIGGPMAQSLDAQVGISPLRRELLPAALPGARSPNAFELGDALETRAPAHGFDVFRLVVALTGLVAFLALPTAVIVGVALVLH
jgi:hypothetical protein